MLPLTWRKAGVISSGSNLVSMFHRREFGVVEFAVFQTKVTYRADSVTGVYKASDGVITGTIAERS
ncbi:hypothetical protein QWZ08_11070 [Ferruginibacter paludis]|uniref:hypothetical protein n=1 Tax=Ferruginibacter paludis TaxID=1310417 RepID=UPI0025B616C3|nr:hypothetical protein [Ferruginibacter paludis]MDN3656171.1 hypothetical protein [Ferruginibacter paludis]